MTGVEIFESVLIVIALVSLWPLAAGHRSVAYSVWLLLMLATMLWVAARRLRRIREAAEEAKRKRDESERSGRPPFPPQ
jgi:uncharacterized membrane protein YjgN (DUF898 family)